MTGKIICKIQSAMRLKPKYCVNLFRSMLAERKLYWQPDRQSNCQRM